MKNISIIVPAYNEGVYIARCLKKLIKVCENYAAKTEIIVVDNNSTDNTGDIANSFDIKYMLSNGRSPGEVRNDGSKEAKFEILAFLDGDCVVPDNWLNKIDEAYDDPIVGAYGGEHIAPIEDNWVVTVWNPTELKEAYEKKAKLPGGNLSIRSSVFKLIGGFDENLISAEDDKLSLDVIAKGYDCVLDNHCAVVHLGYPKTLKDVYLKQVWHGFTQMKAHGAFGDKVVLVTQSWILSWLFLLNSIVFSFPNVFVLSLIGILIFPTLIAVNRLKYHKYIKLKNCLLSIIISIFYISGRSVGLIKEVKGFILKVMKFE
ncbi:glycosyltransferase [Colwellia sp. 1_MG-2023]|uniref:glycosyltransferase n=1 Tax=Colwellia sp. 1_MG-2023 TaxID=3062649 RepID=UPI0026E2E2C3|nr:glycosyltransferase [Colwellia sp. 1_MG-2023]MDO6444975.1 glycosyltransferase [Colwellia sp. 1_MG-2023]